MNINRDEFFFLDRGSINVVAADDDTGASMHSMLSSLGSTNSFHLGLGAEPKGLTRYPR